MLLFPLSIFACDVQVESVYPNYDVSTTTNTTEAYTLHETHYVVSLPVGYDVYMAGKMDDDTREGKVYRYDYTISIL